MHICLAFSLYKCTFGVTIKKIVTGVQLLPLSRGELR